MMRRCLCRIVLALAAIAVVASCNKRPAGVLSDSQMADLLADLELAQAYSTRTGQFMSDSSRKVLRQSVLRDHGVSQAQLDSSLQWYGMNVEQFTVLQDRVADRIKRAQYRDMKGEDAESNADLNTLWPYPQMIRASNRNTTNGFAFSIPVSDLKKGDVLEWSGAIIRPSLGASLLLGVDYTDGVSSYVMKTVPQGHFDLRVQTDTTRTVRRIFGQFRLSESSRISLMVADSLSLSRTPIDLPNYGSIFSQNFFYPKGAVRLVQTEESMMPRMEEGPSPEEAMRQIMAVPSYDRAPSTSGRNVAPSLGGGSMDMSSMLPPPTSTPQRRPASSPARK